MAKLVAALYDDVEDAYEAIEDLLTSGFERESISILSNNISAKPTAPVGVKEKDMLEGSTAGTLVGGVAGAAIGLAALVIPGIGPALAAGPLFAAFFGGTAGAVAGSFIGAFVDWELKDTEADLFAEGVRRGGTLVAVRAEGAAAERARAILDRHNLVNMSERVALWRKLGWTKFDSKARPYTADQVARERAQYRHPSGGVTAGVAETPGEKDTSLMPGKLPGILTFEDREALFREHYEQTYADTGHDFEYYLPAYRFGYNLANDDRYADKEWALIEPDLRRFWDEHSPGMWALVRGAVRFARDAARGQP
jgi:uncharacterized membrane protein